MKQQHSFAKLNRSVLFISAVHEDIFDAAAKSNADLVCLDMEDGVPEALKDQARKLLPSAVATIGSHGKNPVAIRINTLHSRHGLLDLLSVLQIPHNVQIVIPKIESDEEPKWVENICNEAGKSILMHCVIETCNSLSKATHIAHASSNITSLMFGGHDLSNALGVEMSWNSLVYARSRVVHAAASAGINVLDAPDLNVHNQQDLIDSTERSLKFGFTGRITKQIDQIDTINSVFTPVTESISKAKAIIAEFERSPYAQVVVDGKVIEQPAIRALKRTLALAKRQ